jgi:hypothetical protein
MDAVILAGSPEKLTASNVCLEIHCGSGCALRDDQPEEVAVIAADQTRGGGAMSRVMAAFLDNARGVENHTVSITI